MMETAVHYMTSASAVRCGLKMAHWKNNPDGWDMGTATTDITRVTCEACKPRPLA